MKRILLLSDLWGKERSDWSLSYISILQRYFEVSFYDCRELAEIPAKGLSEGELHSKFINGGIKIAVKNLLKQEEEVAAVLGFSVGGTIAWKACVTGLKTQHLFAISATRLRFETDKPGTDIHLVYGGDDPFRPGDQWFQQMEIEPNMYSSQGHDLYKKKEIAEDLTFSVMKQFRDLESPFIR